MIDLLPPKIERIDIPTGAPGVILSAYRSQGETRFLVEMPVTVHFSGGHTLDIGLQAWADSAGNLLTNEPVPEYQFKAIGKTIVEFLAR